MFGKDFMEYLTQVVLFHIIKLVYLQVVIENKRWVCIFV